MNIDVSKNVAPITKHSDKIIDVYKIITHGVGMGQEL
jgi:hypothetical protein